jgi:hypothetical protein
MQRVDEHVGAAKRNPGRDATIAERRDNLSFRRACEARLGQPCRQFAEEFLTHAEMKARFFEMRLNMRFLPRSRKSVVVRDGGILRN